MSYLGDRKPGDTIDFKFTTVNSNGQPSNASTAVPIQLVVYKDNSITEITAGITITPSPFDGRIGLHHVRIVATDAAYTAGSDYAVVVSVGKNGAGVDLIGLIVGEFSLDNRDPALARPEPGQAAPPASVSPLAKIDYLYKAWRNIKKQTATGWSLLGDDDTTVDQKTTVSDDGTTATKNKIISGP